MNKLYSKSGLPMLVIFSLVSSGASGQIALAITRKHLAANAGTGPYLMNLGSGLIEFPSSSLFQTDLLNLATLSAFQKKLPKDTLGLVCVLKKADTIFATYDDRVFTKLRSQVRELIKVIGSDTVTQQNVDDTQKILSDGLGAIRVHAINTISKDLRAAVESRNLAVKMGYFSGPNSSTQFSGLILSLGQRGESGTRTNVFLSASALMPSTGPISSRLGGGIQWGDAEYQVFYAGVAA